MKYRIMLRKEIVVEVEDINREFAMESTLRNDIKSNENQQEWSKATPAVIWIEDGQAGASFSRDFQERG